MRRARLLHPAALAGAVSCAALTVAAFRSGDVALYNSTPSMPIGLYLRTSGSFTRGAIVTVRAIDVAPDYAVQRAFTKPGDRFLKHIIATEGDVVCADGLTVSVSGRGDWRRATHDAEGRLLPTWSGCRTLARNEVLLLGETADSFDGRYWGPTPVSRIEGVWRRLGA